MPIYINGGTITFYLNENRNGEGVTAAFKGTKDDHKDWYPAVQKTGTSFCSSEPKALNVVLKGFTSAGKDAPSPLIDASTKTWMLKLNTEAGRSIYVSYGEGSCGPDRGPRVEVSLRPAGAAAQAVPAGVGFYRDELKASLRDRRYKDTSSTCTDEDACERITSLTYKDVTYDCDDRNCGVHLNLP